MNMASLQKNSKSELTHMELKEREKHEFQIGPLALLTQIFSSFTRAVLSRWVLVNKNGPGEMNRHIVNELLALFKLKCLFISAVVCHSRKWNDTGV